MTSPRHLVTAACLRPTPLRTDIHSSGAAVSTTALLFGQDCTTSAALGAAGCGNINLLSGYRNAEAAILSFIRFAAGLHEERTGV